MQEGITLQSNIAFQIRCEDKDEASLLAQHLEKHFYATPKQSETDQTSFNALVPFMRSDELEEFLKVFAVDYEWIESN